MTIAIRAVRRKSSRDGISVCRNRNLYSGNSSLFGGETLQIRPSASSHHSNRELVRNRDTALEVGTRISEERSAASGNELYNAHKVTSPAISHAEIDSPAISTADEYTLNSASPGRMRIKSFYYTFPPRSPSLFAARTSSVLMTDLSTPLEDEVIALAPIPMTKTESQRGRDMTALQTALGFPEVQVASPMDYSQQ
ncbi:hypothetical protein BDQ17DRAFT_1341698 [Cyathus striatus]|nr:hypothetical protein BDQ17DRAFT_1341698 [Cyathus striatus]